MTYYVVSPAYGRDYKNQAEVKADWNSGKDFVHESAMHTGGGTYINNQQVKPGDSVQVYYDKKRKHMVISR